MENESSNSKIKWLALLGLSIGIDGTAVGLGVYFGTKQEPCEPGFIPNNPIKDYTRPGFSGALVDYVYKQDNPEIHGWKIYRRERQEERNVETLVINLTSQYWMDEELTNHRTWYHNLILHIPDNIVHQDAALLYISLGDNDGSEINLDGRSEVMSARFAASTGIPSAVLRMVPNQPIVMGNDDVPRSEDDLIAWTMRRFFNDTFTNTQDPDLLLLFPMTKSAVRAMDTVTTILKNEADLDTEKFLLSGVSKRGWTTWLTGAIDRRVVAMAPVVLSCLNMVENFEHYWQSFGGWPFSLFDYWNHGIMANIHEPKMGQVAYYIDPLNYRQWMNIPKFVINGASDEFFLLDDFDYFYDQLPGEKHMWIIENAGHNIHLSPSAVDALVAVEAFFLSALKGHDRPTFQYTREVNVTGGLIRMSTSQTPKLISSWAALSNTPLTGGIHRRDWRLHVLDAGNIVPSGIIWNETVLTDLGSNNYEVYYGNPPFGYLAFFIKVVFDAPGGRDYFASTKAQIIPDNFPFEPCEGQACHGSLVLDIHNTLFGKFEQII